MKKNKYDIGDYNSSEERSNLSEGISNFDNNIRKIYQSNYKNKEHLNFTNNKTGINKKNNIYDYRKYKTEIIQNIENEKLKNFNINKNNKDLKIKNKLNGTLVTSCSIKIGNKEIEFLPLKSDLSFLDNNSIVSSSRTKKSMDIINEVSNIRQILEEKDKKFKMEYENRKQTFFITNILYKKKNTIIECPLLLKKNELYILNPIINEPLFFSSENNIMLKSYNNGNNIYNNDISLKEETKTILIENRYNLSNPLFYINFDLLSCKLLIHKKTKWITILILGYQKNINIYITNKEKYDTFIYLINEIIFKSKGYKINLFELSLRKSPKFINHNFINLKEFESIAKTGDILLFRTRFCASRFQRLLSGDIYDHVALIERKNDILSLYQSSLNGNIDFVFWDHYVDNSLYLFYDLVTYRRLNIEAENEIELEKKQKDIIDNFEDFVNETKNKKYYLSIKNLVFCSGLEEKQRKGEWNKLEGFSCSSLAIAFYIKIGAIKYDRNIHSIKPGDFQSNKNLLKFSNKFSLGPEKIIEFNN